MQYPVSEGESTFLDWGIPETLPGSVEPIGRPLTDRERNVNSVLHLSGGPSERIKQMALGVSVKCFSFS